MTSNYELGICDNCLEPTEGKLCGACGDCDSCCQCETKGSDEDHWRTEAMALRHDYGVAEKEIERLQADNEALLEAFKALFKEYADGDWRGVRGLVKDSTLERLKGLLE